MTAKAWLRSAERVATGGLCGLALFAWVAHLLLLLHCSVTTPLLPASLLLGFALARPAAQDAAGAGAPRWLVATSLLLLLTATAAVTFGSLATASRCWDGAVAWDVKAAALAAAPTLEQPFFHDWGVFCHSRDYQLTLPLLLASGERLGVGRAALPFVYALLLLLVGSVLRRAGRGGALAWLGALGLGLTPMLLNPASGAVDSGYAEPLLLLATSGMAAGLLLRAPLLLASGATLAVLSKPEGLLYGALPIALLFLAGEQRLLRAAVAGWLIASVVWLPLQHDLGCLGAVSFAWPLPAAVVAAAVVVLLLDRVVPARRRTRLILAALALPALVLLPAGLCVALGDTYGTFGVYLADPERVLQRLPQLPQIVAGCLQCALFRQFGLAFWLLLALAAAALSRRRRFANGLLAGFLGLGLLSVLVPFLLSPEPDLQHHIASSMNRLLLHWLGAVFLLVASELGRPDRFTVPAGASVPDTRR